jgi:hypothetical protein
MFFIVKPELPRILKNSKAVSPVSSHFESYPSIFRREFQKSRFSGAKIGESGMNFLKQTYTKSAFKKNTRRLVFDETFFPDLDIRGVLRMRADGPDG